MIGIDLEDVKQSIWTEYFRVCAEDKDDAISKSGMLEKLKHFASAMKRKEGERKFGQRHIMNESFEIEAIGITNLHWRKVRHLWEEFISKQNVRDGIILRFAAQGVTNEQIAQSVKLDVQTIKNRRSYLIRKFKEEVENNVQADQSSGN